jgi:hypothetical protein
MKLARTGGDVGKVSFECLTNINLKTGLIEDSSALCSFGGNGKRISVNGRGSISVNYRSKDGKKWNTIRKADFELSGEIARLIYAQMPGKPVEGDDRYCNSGMLKSVPGLECMKGANCFVEINLETGQLEAGLSGDWECPEGDVNSELADLDAKGNREPLQQPPSD